MDSETLQRPVPLRLAGFGVYEPRERRSSEALDKRFGKADGWTRDTFGLRSRGIAAPDETTSAMGAAAAREALAVPGWTAGEFDVLIGACSVMEQPIPGTSVLIQHALDLGGSGLAAFDVNQTCLSFMTALDVAAMGFAAGRWRRALIVSSEVASAGLDYDEPATAALFGDGAAAVCVETGPLSSGGPALLARRFETYGEGHRLATLRTGGTRVRVEGGFDAVVAGARFRMDAFGIFKAAARRLPVLVDRVLEASGLTRESVDLIVPHQASRPGLEHVRRLMGGDPARVVDIFEDHGNQIAASVPTALALAAFEGRLRPGSHVLLLGTAAGVSVAAMVLRI